MLAIHNQVLKKCQCALAANAFAKLSKCQQFTTSTVIELSIMLLQTLLQSYQNVSNSQRRFEKAQRQISCKRFCKVIKMLAIHNTVSLEFSYICAANAFAKLSKCQQFTTLLAVKILQKQLQTLLQSYQNVSNSQLKHFTM